MIELRKFELREFGMVEKLEESKLRNLEPEKRFLFSVGRRYEMKTARSDC